MRVRQLPVSKKHSEAVCAPNKKEQHWSDWHWTKDGIFRHQGIDLETNEECSDPAYLEAQLLILEEIKAEYSQKATYARGQRKKDFERGIKDKDEQIKYVSQRLEGLITSAKIVKTIKPEKPAMPKPVSVQVVEFEELSEDEQRDRLHLERRVERAVFEAGRALRELRDRRLYRSTHKTFEEYCLDRFGYKRRHSYQLIDAANVFDNLLINGDDPEMCANGAQNDSSSLTNIFLEAEEIAKKKVSLILPSSERQVRPLAKLNADQQREAWQQAVDEAGGEIPSGRTVKDVVQRIRQRTLVPISYRIGEVCQIIAKDTPELKGKGGSWCIVNEVNEFSVMVAVKGKEYQVKPENLKSTDLDSQQQEKFKQICGRIDALYAKCADEPLAMAVLDQWFYEKRYWLTPLEEKMLCLLEQDLA